MTRFSTERIFFVSDDFNGIYGWYAQMREGTFGPFASRKLAADGLADRVYSSRENREEVWG